LALVRVGEELDGLLERLGRVHTQKHTHLCLLSQVCYCPNFT
jgi:hypothetical protein